MNYKSLLKLKAKTPHEILSELSSQLEFEKAKDQPSLPRVALYRGSTYWEGFLINYSEQQQLLLLGIIDGHTVNLKYIDSSVLSAVEVLNAKPLLYTISDGEMEEILDEQMVPSKLQIKAELKKTREMLSGIVGNKLTLEIDFEINEKSEKKVLSERMLWPYALDCFASAIKQLCEDPLGKEALCDSVQNIVLKPGNKTVVSINAETLTIVFDLAKGGKRIGTAKALQETIEENL